MERKFKVKFVCFFKNPQEHSSYIYFCSNLDDWENLYHLKNGFIEWECPDYIEYKFWSNKHEQITRKIYITSDCAIYHYFDEKYTLTQPF